MNRLPQALSAVLLAVTTSAGLDGATAGETLVPLILGEALTCLLGVSLAEAARIRTWGREQDADQPEVADQAPRAPLEQ